MSIRFILDETNADLPILTVKKGNVKEEYGGRSMMIGAIIIGDEKPVVWRANPRKWEELHEKYFTEEENKKILRKLNRLFCKYLEEERSKLS